MRLHNAPLLISGLFLCLLACQPKVQPSSTQPRTQLQDDTTFSIAFGSCSDEDKPQRLWEEILAERPDAWVWLGDNIYGDSDKRNVLSRKYDKQKNHPLYLQLRAQTEILGVWDDHDYGVNDGGRHFHAKAMSQQVFLDFLDVPQTDSRRTREGTYHTTLIEKHGLSVRFILLDARYFRDDMVKKKGRYEPNMDGTILGKAQWAWLSGILASSQADYHVIASGIQVLPTQHRFEKWANFPLERVKLMDLMDSLYVNRPIFISGDRHVGEISKLRHKDQTLYDITSSSLTHGWSQRRPESNALRQGELVYDINYGLLLLSKDSAIALLKGEDGQILESVTLEY